MTLNEFMQLPTGAGVYYFDADLNRQVNGLKASEHTITWEDGSVEDVSIERGWRALRYIFIRHERG